MGWLCLWLMRRPLQMRCADSLWMPIFASGWEPKPGLQRSDASIFTTLLRPMREYTARLRDVDFEYASPEAENWSAVRMSSLLLDLAAGEHLGHERLLDHISDWPGQHLLSRA